MKLRPIIFGATGMVGEGVLHVALQDPDVESVLVVGRRPCGVTHPKLREILHDNFYDYSKIERSFKEYNACLFCLGVTSVGKKEEEYRRLTYDLTIAAAKSLSSANPSMAFCYVSGAGTDSSEQGDRMWARVKGKTENDLRKLPFGGVYAIRPGFIKPIPGLKNALTIAKIVAPLYPLLKRFSAKYVCTLEELGRAMIRVASGGDLAKATVIECEDIHRLGTTGPA